MKMRGWLGGPERGWEEVQGEAEQIEKGELRHEDQGG